ncbi:MAG TPA: P1 family peptidase [Gemmatimonadaceae bacterium]|nr:P1 family peptidase [Gemmatimonadaceae bacterium]
MRRAPERGAAVGEGVSTSDFSSLGIAVGHATDGKGATGLTVIRPVDGTTAWRGAAAIVGRATATREVPTVAVDHISKRIDAILLTGGSAYGLDAAAGVMRWMEERGRGFPIAGGVVPIVPAAAVFDLAPLGRFDSRPSPQMAYDACDRASTDDIAEGSVGAGTGCTVGKAAGRNYAMKGGVGRAIELHGDVSVAAIAVVNAFGDVRDAEGKIIAGARDADGRWLDSASIIGDAALGVAPLAVQPDPQTTLCVIATNAVYTGAELQQLARASSAALHRRITPAGTSFDGDIVFAICPQGGDGPVPALPGIEVIAARTLETAIERAVRLAKGREGIPGLAD